MDARKLLDALVGASSVPNNLKLLGRILSKTCLPCLAGPKVIWAASWGERSGTPSGGSVILERTQMSCVSRRSKGGARRQAIR